LQLAARRYGAWALNYLLETTAPAPRRPSAPALAGLARRSYGANRQADLQVMSTSELSTQSAVARRSAEAELRTLIAKYAPAQLRLIGAIRRWLLKRLPTAHEVVYEYRGFFVISYSPNERGYEGVLTIRASTDGIRLYFNRAKALPDPADLLQGSAKQVRWIDLEGASTLARPAVARLVKEAIARNPVPFARAGRGSMVIRSTAAKKRQGKVTAVPTRRKRT
jgi:hypothetical protein